MYCRRSYDLFAASLKSMKSPVTICTLRKLLTVSDNSVDVVGSCHILPADRQRRGKRRQAGEVQRAGERSHDLAQCLSAVEIEWVGCSCAA